MSSDNRDEDHFDRSFWQNSTSYDSSSKILLVTIVSFSIIILIAFVYHLYARFVLYRRRPAFQGLSFSVVSQPPIRGLDKLVIASLPTFVVGVNGDDVSAVECAVCLSFFEEKDTVRMLPNCKHVFHVTCVDTWLASCSTCPICRTEVEPSQSLLPEPREGPNVDGASALDFTAASSSDNKRGGSTFRRNDHSRVDQDRVLDIERQ
ncbi:RING-H2 finger protein ATL40-like [Raphanus sativus]|uniref:RING-type E3 ubiquitin transferase n=1 Tax=Raphanus sativus TaxID=3726 RepID=A0A6J0NH50_RAPSA|nr:RING-H2 finger protein ATL40-like [Raphanus sativus]